MTDSNKKKTAKILDGKFVWHGPDRRKSTDRRAEDRRREIRFEPDADDRREPADRRQDDRSANAYSQAKHPDRKPDDAD